MAVKTASTKEIRRRHTMDIKGERVLSKIPITSFGEQFRQILAVLHTNPDCRYSGLQSKKLDSAIVYLPGINPYGWKPLQEEEPQDTKSDELEAKEPVFISSAYELCLNVLSGLQKVNRTNDSLETEKTCNTMTPNNLLPNFFNGPLSQAVDLVRRKHGCAWPALLLFLYNPAGPGNYNFIKSVLCNAGQKFRSINALETDQTAGDDTNIVTINDYPKTRFLSVNEVLVDRGAKLIPWDCSQLTYKETLMSAFKGTRLEQWLKTLDMRSELPSIVAVGRNSKGNVLCSLVNGNKTSLLETINWLDTVTKAHFTDYEDTSAGDGEKNAKLKTEDSDLTVCPSGENENIPKMSIAKDQKMAFSQVHFERYAKVLPKVSKSRSKKVQSSYANVSKATLLVKAPKPGLMVMPKKSKPKPSLEVNDGHDSELTFASVPDNQKKVIAHIDANTSTTPDLMPEDWPQFTPHLKFAFAFMQKYTTDLPVSPMFLLSRFSTAVARCLNPVTEEQCKPLLVYLHDDDGVGAPHFVANILCSRRFNNLLYDRGLMIWPLNLTGVVREVGVFKTPAFGSSTSLPRKRKAWQEFILNPRRGTKALAKCQSNQLKHLPAASINGAQSNLSNEDVEFNRKLPNLAWSLIELFKNHPVHNTFETLIKQKVLPVVINLKVERKIFTADSVLYPNSTTKQSVCWLAKVIHSFDTFAHHQPTGVETEEETASM